MKGDSEMMMMGVRSANQSPQSVGSSGMDSGVDSLSDQLGDLPHVAISLCGGLTDNREITRGRLRNEHELLCKEYMTELAHLLHKGNSN